MTPAQHGRAPALRPLLPDMGGGQLALDFGVPQRQLDIAVIHEGTGLYTASPEIEALLDRLHWPAQGCRLLDPGAGNGGFLVAALNRLDLGRDDIGEAARRVKGYEFYDAALQEARCAIRDHLQARGWSVAAARQAAVLIAEDRDYLLASDVPGGVFDTVVTNPPYWRLLRLPAAYRADFELMVPRWARADLLYAYLQKSAEIVAPGGRIALISADRWLLNSGSRELRERLGRLFRVTDVCRLEPASSFYRAKTRRRGTLPRVHPVSLVLSPGSTGRRLGAEPFRLSALPDVDGVPLPAIATIRLSPYLGPDGIFLVGSGAQLPREHLVPAVEPEDINEDGTLAQTRRWAIVTWPRIAPPPEIAAHLRRELPRMSGRGRRGEGSWWLPPETFAGKLPLDRDAVLVPRLATHLRAIHLPAGVLPVNHQLVVVSSAGHSPAALAAMLRDPLVQAQADALAPRYENGYAGYTTTLLRQLVIPRHHLEPWPPGLH